MRNLSNISAALSGEALTFCLCWTLTRRDGVSFGFTDHDADIEIGGIVHLARTGMSGGDSDSALGFSIDNGHLQGALTDARITAEDINAGLYDGALLLIRRVNWASPLQHISLSRGYLGQITQQGDRFSAEWTGEGAKLDRSQGRVFSRLCDASFGDARCGLDPLEFPDGTLCPRSFSACQSQFNNVKNFRGFPFLLGDDALTAAPQESDIRDGGSRYRKPG
jgi:hypothetical protein